MDADFGVRLGREVLSRFALIGPAAVAVKQAADTLSAAEQKGDSKAQTAALLKLSEAHLNAGSLEEALLHATSALNMAKQGSAKAGEAAALEAIAKAHHAKHVGFVQRGQRPYPAALAMAQKHLGEADALYSSLQDKPGVFRVKRELAEVLVSKAELQMANVTAQEAIQAAKAAGDKAGEARARTLLSSILVQMDVRMQDACEEAQTGMLLYHELRDITGRRRALLTLSAALGAKDDWTDPLSSLRLYFQTTGNPACEVYALLAAISGDLGDTYTGKREMLKLGDEAVSMCKASADKSGEAEALLVVAEACLSKGLVDRSLQAAQQSATLCQQMGDKLEESKALSQVARAHLAQSKSSAKVNQQALAAAQKALEIAVTAASSQQQAIAKLTVADAQLGEGGNFDLAVKLAEEAMAFFTTDEDLYDTLVAGSLTLARAHSLGKNPKDASIAAMQAAALAAEAGDVPSEAEAWLLAANEALQDGNIKDALSSAFVAEKRFRELKDSERATKAAKVISSVQESTMSSRGFLPKRRDGQAPYPELQLAPASGKKDRSWNALECDTSDTIVWCSPTADTPYIKLCFEVSALINAVMNSRSKARVIIMTRGVHTRQCGGIVPQTQTNALATSMWALGRCFRLEQAKLPVMVMDVCPYFTGDDIARCLPWTDTDVAWYPGPKTA
mmetsp:Transcript_62675/g.149515  ORF Transcript_62675/g.149515 Transcript_62675/m.149515 type:complete len:677 (-) Transcript_62675:107-2137(-)